jgi:hypothetical protein
MSKNKSEEEKMQSAIVQANVIKILTDCRNELIAEYNVSGYDSDRIKIGILVRSIDKQIRDCNNTRKMGTA